MENRANAFMCVSCAFAVCGVSEEKECCRIQFSMVCDMYMMIFVFFSFLFFDLLFLLFRCCCRCFIAFIFLTEGIHNNRILFAHVSARYCGCRRDAIVCRFFHIDDALDTVVAAAAVFLLVGCIHFYGKLLLLAFWLNLMEPWTQTIYIV